jgi:hypothetical protein
MTFIKQFGLQRSGTNYFKALVELNFPGTTILTNTLGNKHNAVSWQDLEESAVLNLPARYSSCAKTIIDSIQSKELNLIFHTKDPLAWLVSFFQLRQNKNPEIYRVFKKVFISNSLDHFFQTLDSWLQLAGESRNHMFIHYDSFIRDEQAYLRSFADKFNLHCPVSNLRAGITRRTIRGAEEHTGRELFSDDRFCKDGYLAKSYLNAYNKHLLEFTASEIMVRRAHYPRVSGYLSASLS